MYVYIQAWVNITQSHSMKPRAKVGKTMKFIVRGVVEDFFFFALRNTPIRRLTGENSSQSQAED